MPGPALALPTVTHGADSHYEATLTATDSGGLAAARTFRLDPRTATLRIETAPAGGTVTLVYYGSNPFATPYERPEAINFPTTIVAQQSFAMGGRTFEFQDWSDGPTTRARDFIMPDTPTTLVARYRVVASPPPRRPPLSPFPDPLEACT